MSETEQKDKTRHYTVRFTSELAEFLDTDRPELVRSLFLAFAKRLIEEHETGILVERAVVFNLEIDSAVDVPAKAISELLISIRQQVDEQLDSFPIPISLKSDVDSK